MDEFDPTDAPFIENMHFQKFCRHCGGRIKADGRCGHCLSEIPNYRSDRMRQPTPGMQLMAIMGCLEGHTSNFEEGIIDKSRFLYVVKQHLKDLKEITKAIS